MKKEKSKKYKNAEYNKFYGLKTSLIKLDKEY